MTEHQAEATQADADAMAQAATATDTERTGQASEPTRVEDLPKWVQDEIKAARKEAATYRTKVKTYEDAQKTEAEKQAEALEAANSRTATLLARVRDLTAQSAVTEAAREAGAIEPALIYRAVRGDLEYDDDGNPTNVAAVLADLQKTAPSVFRAAGGSGDGGRGNGQGTKQDLNALVRAALQP